MYLYRAVDKAGQTVDFFLSRNRDVNAATSFLRNAMKNTRVPTKITLDAYAPPQQALRVITRNRVSPAISLPISHRNRIQNVQGVVEVMPFQYFGGVYEDPKNIFARYAVEPEAFFKIRTDSPLSEDEKLAFRREKRACVVGRGLVRRYGFQTGDRLTIKDDIFPVNVDLMVVGIYDNPSDNAEDFKQGAKINKASVSRRECVGTLLKIPLC